MSDSKQRRPGDLILDRYMPNATEDQREEARANLKAFAAILIAINQRIERETAEKLIRAKSSEAVNLDA